MPFMSAQKFIWDGMDVFVSRSGYTGEDGFEISLPADDAEAFARRLLAQTGGGVRSGSARATRCGWKPGFASTATN